MKTKSKILEEIIEANNNSTLEMAREIQKYRKLTELLSDAVKHLTNSLARAEGELKNLKRK